jgi:hypothetical protein
LFLAACNKEPATQPSAEFTTNLNNNTITTGTPFVVYTNKIVGEWAVYFRGADSVTTYSVDFYRAEGVNIDLGLDSISVSGYNLAGEYPFTVVASISGNWAEDYLQDVKSITISVIDD